MNFSKHIYVFIIILLAGSALPDLHADHDGGAIAGGVIGGLALGTILGSAAASRRSNYYDDNYYYDSDDTYVDELEAENQQLRAQLRAQGSRNNSRTMHDNNEYATLHDRA